MEVSRIILSGTIGLALCSVGVFAASWSTVTGTVADDGGGSIQGAEILLHFDPAGPRQSAHRDDIVVASDALGGFDARLGPGFYDVCVMASAFSPECRKIFVSEGKGVQLDFRLKVDALVSQHLGDKVFGGLNVDQARELVMAVLTAEQKRLPKLGAEPYDDPHKPGFLFFTVTWAGTPNGSVVVGNYAVDRFTGDVWSAVIGCYEEKNEGLQALQVRIRAAMGLSASDYQQIKTKGPLCD